MHRSSQHEHTQIKERPTPLQNTADEKVHRTPPKANTDEHCPSEPLEFSPVMGLIAGEEASRYAQDFDLHSKLAHRTRRRRKITQLRWSELQIGKLLGEGNFSHVYEVTLEKALIDDTETVTTCGSKKTITDDVWQIQTPSWKDDDEANDIWDLISTDGNGEAIDETDHKETVPTDKELVYALKHLHPQVTVKQRDFTASAIDLVLEAKLLGCLDHPNIVKLFGVTKGSVSTVFQTKGYFLLLDRLHGTLEDKMQEWQQMENRLEIFRTERSHSIASTFGSHRRNSGVRGSTRQRSADSNMLAADALAAMFGVGYNIPLLIKMIEERLGTVAVDVCKGMEYLHRHKIIFRDLKPSNVGFTLQGTAKIFDFGLAREILDNDRRMTGNIGSLRYMAPEVNRREHYHLSADVYSFGVMLWEMCTLKKAFKGMTKEEHSDLVINKGFRPKISAVPGSPDLRHLIQACWEADASRRPTFTKILRSFVVQFATLKQAEELVEVKETKEPATLISKLTRQRRGFGTKEKGGRRGSGLLLLSPFLASSKK